MTKKDLSDELNRLLNLSIDPIDFTKLRRPDLEKLLEVIKEKLNSKTPLGFNILRRENRPLLTIARKMLSCST